MALLLLFIASSLLDGSHFYNDFLIRRPMSSPISLVSRSGISSRSDDDHQGSDFDSHRFTVITNGSFIIDDDIFLGASHGLDVFLSGISVAQFTALNIF